MNLTQKQEDFAVEYLINGRDATKAYQKAYDTKTTRIETVWVNAHKVLHNEKVQQRIHDLEMQTLGVQILSIEERKKMLTKMAINGDLKAIAELNKMDGAYAAEKLEHSGNVEIKRVINLNPSKG